MYKHLTITFCVAYTKCVATLWHDRIYLSMRVKRLSHGLVCYSALVWVSHLGCKHGLEWFQVIVSVQTAPLSVSKCLKVFKSVWSWMYQSEISCIVVTFSLHCWEFMETYFKMTKVSMGISTEQYRSRIVITC